MAAGEERKKRAADRQITKDDPEEDNNDDIHTEPSRGFPKADEETMKKRRLVKAVKPTIKEGDDTTKKNPFANVSLKSRGGSVFGSGFGAGGGVKPSFGFASGGFSAGSGFPTSSQGANSSTASVFGSAFSGGLTSTTSSDSAFGSTSTAAKAEEPQAEIFPDHVDLKTGEEDEQVILELRAKSFLLVEKKEPKQVEQVDDSVHSVPPSSLTAPVAKEENGTKEAATDTEVQASGDQQASVEQESKESQKAESSKRKEESEPSEPSKKDSKGNGDDGGGKPKASDGKREKEKHWQELGKGPLRILKKDAGHTRVVHRLEYAEGGAGTKVLINAPLSKESEVGQPPSTEKHVRLTTIEPSGKAAIYLLKVASSKDRDKLKQILEREVDQAESLVAG